MRVASEQRPVGREDSAAEARLTDLFDRNVDDLYRFCLARSGDPEMAADATAEVFLAAARLASEGRGVNVDRAWLFTVAKRRLIDQWRAAGRELRRVERLGVTRSRDLGGSLGDEVRFVSAAEVVQALGSLPDRQRAALTLRYLDECSVSEVAGALSIEYSAAESLLARGRRSFEQAWVARGPQPEAQGG
jgi:RNA polymerase sigma-70 factor (ECF subfamily)